LNRRALLALLALLGLIAVISNTTYRKRKQERAILEDREESYVADVDSRFIDLGVRLCVVTADPDGDELLADRPRLRVLREYRFGGILDKKEKAIVAGSQSPLVWLASEDQETILRHTGPRAAQLVEGSEGAGKTTVLAMWHYLQWLAHLGEGREGLQTAPTNLRLGLVRREIRKLWRADWYRFVQRKEFAGLELCDGSSIRMVSTHRQSEAAGSPVQGFNSSWAGRDETQDQTDVHEDIESRGRAAKHGIYPQLGTATMKDTPTYDAFRDELAAGGQWEIRQLLMCEAEGGDLSKLTMRTPFVPKAFVESKRGSMSEREFRRRFLAEKLTAELRVFFGFERQRNLVPVPRIAIDVTHAILADYRSYLRPGARSTLLVGHDPGNIFNTSVVLKLLMFGTMPVWLVVGELQTEQTTAHQHARELIAYLRRAFNVNLLEDRASDRAVVFVDPHGRGETQTDYQTVYGAFQAEGLDVFNPAGMNKTIKRSARVEMTNRLCYSASHEIRFCVGVDEHGKPVAPVLVDALQSLKKRKGEEDPEGQRRKDVNDKTHAPAATGYALWPFEQEALTATTQKRAIAASGLRR
jgi:hypothetical protein